MEDGCKISDMTRLLYRLFAAAIAATILTACNSEQDQIEKNIYEIAGIWHFEGNEAGQQVDVYLGFCPVYRTFDLYQKIGEGAYKHFTGSFTMTSSMVLSGKYDSGISWAREYTVSRSGSLLKLSAGDYSCEYTSADVIPEDVIDHSVPTRSTDDEDAPVL